MNIQTKQFTIGLLEEMRDINDLVVNGDDDGLNTYYHLLNAGMELPVMHAVEYVDGSLVVEPNPMLIQILRSMNEIEHSEFDMLPRFFKSKILRIQILTTYTKSEEVEQFRRNAKQLTIKQ